MFSFAIMLYELFTGRLIALRTEFLMGGVDKVEEYAQRRAEVGSAPACMLHVCTDQSRHHANMFWLSWHAPVCGGGPAVPHGGRWQGLGVCAEAGRGAPV